MFGWFRRRKKPQLFMEAEVRKGIALLDAIGPHGWRNRIVLSRLNLADGENCVLGQVYGSYGTGLFTVFRDYDLLSERSAQHGFTPGWDNEQKYPELTRTWKQLINA